LILFNVFRPNRIALSTSRRSFRTKMTSPVSLATSVPDPMAMPITGERTDQVPFIMLSRLHIFVLAIAVLFCAPAWAEGEKGWFGFAVSADTEGFSLNPVLRSVKIEKIVPLSPAAMAGLAAGDDVLEVDGIVVAGTKADVLLGRMQKTVGETLILSIKNERAEAHKVRLTAVPKGQVND
jgi:PDZ domain